MGKSPASCFKIIGCGGDSVDHDDLQTPEGKGSSDRRIWSFRKRSARHRVLSNNVSSETPLSVTKETPESPAVSFNVPEKTSAVQLTEGKTSAIELTEEKTEFPAQLESELSDTLPALEDVCKADAISDEASIIIIQAGIRRLLAEQVLLRQKNVIKLQAAVRGHLVRRQAVGTLRCVQSIVKMQALVRARRACRVDKVLGDSFKGKKEAKSNAEYTYVSIEKLLSNAFASQLMESRARTKPINIKCEPSKGDSAWKWFERWMSASSVSLEGSQESGSTVEDYKEDLLHSDVEQDILLMSDSYAESEDLKSGMGKLVDEVSENRANLTISLESEVTESAPNEVKETDFIEVESGETGNECNGEQPETEVKKLLKKTSNPAFIAAQSKFEELGLAATSTKLTSSSSLALGVESGLDKVSPATSAVQISSECGTELSISSTLDSSHSSVNGIEHETKVISNEAEGQPKSGENIEIEAIEKSPTLETDTSFTSKNDSERFESSANLATAAPINSINDEGLPSAEKKQEANLIGQQLDLKSEASPRSNAMVLESQTTPSSQVSIKPKLKGQKSDPSLKKKSSSADKNRNQDSGIRNSLEQLPEPKSGKRRNSFGSAKLEHDPTDNSSSNSLPSYMQATESAKAKALLIVANGSPRSSPDVLDKDTYLKKRHSLTGNNERQGSPRIQRSMSQAHQSAKGNANNSPQDRKWRR